MNSGLEHDTVLVTGASGGIGQAVVRAFAAEGCRLALHYFQHGEAAAALARSLPVPSVLVRADLRSESEVAGLFAEALQRFPRIDHVVVNAGIWREPAAPLHEMSLEQWRETLDVDLTGAFLTCREFFRHLAAQRRESASVVFISSTAGLFGEAGHADYAAAKSALCHGLTSSLKNEIVALAPRGRVNCVCPGWTVTPMTEGLLEDRALVRRVTSTMALKKIATAEDVAAAVVFLASGRLAGHLTGAVLPVAGGMEGRLLEP